MPWSPAQPKNMGRWWSCSWRRLKSRKNSTGALLCLRHTKELCPKILVCPKRMPCQKLKRFQTGLTVFMALKINRRCSGKAGGYGRRPLCIFSRHSCIIISQHCRIWLAGNKPQRQRTWSYPPCCSAARPVQFCCLPWKWFLKPWEKMTPKKRFIKWRKIYLERPVTTLLVMAYQGWLGFLWKVPLHRVSRTSRNRWMLWGPLVEWCAIFFRAGWISPRAIIWRVLRKSPRLPWGT